MAERPEDLNLPITVVQRIIKEALPDGVVVSKEARQTISRASSVFVLYLTACAVTHANKSKRKTLAVNDILSAIEDMEFDSFIQPLNDALKARKDGSSSNTKKSNAKNTSSEKGVNKRNSGAANDDEEEEIEDEAVEDDNVEDIEDNVLDEENANDSVSHQTKKRKLSKTNNTDNGFTNENSSDSNENNNKNEDDEDDN